jgi:hypothetical protein
MKFRPSTTVLRLAAALLITYPAHASSPPAHVLVISVDGMHTLDLALFVKQYPASTMAALVHTGYNYASASTPKPSDSLPGNLALCTGGSPLSTGVFYDRSYDRSLWPPNTFTGPTGTPVIYDESVDLNSLALDGGGGLNPAALPRDPARSGAIVYPHNYLRVNTTFEVVRAAGYRTAWIDKHVSDEIVQGPSGQGVDDLWTPEIAANYPLNGGLVSINKSVDATIWYDNLKVQGLLNQIAGYDHLGSNYVGVPALFGMNFQALSVAQKLAKNNTLVNGNSPAPFRIGGYYDGSGTPSMNVSNALYNTDAALGSIVTALRANHLLESTYIILTSKHGQGPIDTNKVSIIPPGTVSNLVALAGAPAVMQTADTSALLWLANPATTPTAVSTLLISNNQVTAGIQDVWSGEKLKLLYGDPAIDPRVPDIIAVGKPGVIYRTGTSTFAEHGGYSDQEVNVPIVVSNPGFRPHTFQLPVTIMQIAPTVLRLLNLDPGLLQAVQIERTPVLPGFDALQAGLNPFPPSLGLDGGSTLQGTGTATIIVNATRRQDIVVQASPDLISWTPVTTNSLLFNASTVITDPDATNATRRFYRTVSP